MRQKIIVLWLLLIILAGAKVRAQKVPETQAFSKDTILSEIASLKEKYLSTVNAKMIEVNDQIVAGTDRTIKKLVKKEMKMKSKLARIDSTQAKYYFGYAIDSLKKIESLFSNQAERARKILGSNHLNYLDTLKSSLICLDNARKTMANLDQLEARLSTADQLNDYLKQRETVLQSLAGKFQILAGDIKGFGTEAAYYQGQINAYKQTLADREKIEKLVVGYLEKLPVFQQLVQQNSQLAGLFASGPGASPLSPPLTATPIVNGLPSRATVQKFVKQTLPGTDADPSRQVRQKIEDGTAGTDELNDQLEMLKKKAGTDKDPSLNSQRTKPFKKRLVFGITLQFASSTTTMPAYENLGVEAGYRANDQCSFGVGAAYRLGLGRGWGHIQFSSESMGLRTWLKWKLKGDFFLRGGGEWNYMTQFSSTAQLRNVNAWQTSALLGLEKRCKIGRTKSGNVQLLYDFFYHQHIPASQPLMVRFGYNF